MSTLRGPNATYKSTLRGPNAAYESTLRGPLRLQIQAFELFVSTLRGPMFVTTLRGPIETSNAA